jgi:putative ABC transport system ATP-binding protein
MLSLQHVTKRFNGKTVLAGISCLIENGDFIVIVGTNGSGKTTLFDIIAGTVIPDEGIIEYRDAVITTQDECQRSMWMSRLLQNTSLNCVPSMTVAENFALAMLKIKSARFSPALDEEKRAIILARLREFKLDVHIDTPMGNLSGGQRQLIAFIMATITHPQLLLLDEPTAALDPLAATILLKTVALYNKSHGLTTLLITHDPHMAVALGNKIWVLQSGVITKTYNHEEKINLSPEDLIGHIDYRALA